MRHCEQKQTTCNRCEDKKNQAGRNHILNYSSCRSLRYIKNHASCPYFRKTATTFLRRYIHESIDIIAKEERVVSLSRETRKKRERKVKCGAKGRQRRKDCKYPPPFSFVHQEVPRLRGHSKFSRLFRQRRESPSKLMLPGHAISPSHSSLCSIFLACSIPFPPLEQDAA